MVTGAEQLQDRVEAAHAARERESMPSALERRDIALECLTRGIRAARVLVPLVATQPLLHVGGREVHRRHDGAAQRIWALPRVDGAGAEPAPGVRIEYSSHSCAQLSGSIGG